MGQYLSQHRDDDNVAHNCFVFAFVSFLQHSMSTSNSTRANQLVLSFSDAEWSLANQENSFKSFDHYMISRRMASIGQGFVYT